MRVKWVNKEKYMELALSKYQLLLLLQVVSAAVKEGYGSPE